MTEKLKFSGISFGGRNPNVTVYGKTHKVIFGRIKKGQNQGKFGYEVHENKGSWSSLKKLCVLFPMFDVVVFLTYTFAGSVAQFFIDLFAPISETIGPSLPTISISIELLSWLITGGLLCLYFLLYILLYILVFKGVRKWHGTEHKVIIAAENHDIENAKKYDPIAERCGGTLLPTILLGYFVWVLIFNYTGILFGQMTITTIFIFMNVKYFHKYDKVGIYVGKLVQKYLTIKEPDDWQLHLGKQAMKSLIEAETSEKYQYVGETIVV